MVWLYWLWSGYTAAAATAVAFTRRFAIQWRQGCYRILNDRHHFSPLVGLTLQLCYQSMVSESYDDFVLAYLFLTRFLLRMHIEILESSRFTCSSCIHAGAVFSVMSACQYCCMRELLQNPPSWMPQAIRLLMDLRDFAWTVPYAVPSY